MWTRTHSNHGHSPIRILQATDYTHMDSLSPTVFKHPHSTFTSRSLHSVFLLFQSLPSLYLVTAILFLDLVSGFLDLHGLCCLLISWLLPATWLCFWITSRFWLPRLINPCIPACLASENNRKNKNVLSQ